MRRVQAAKSECQNKTDGRSPIVDTVFQAKCDVWTGRGVPCSRCERMGKPCVLAGAFQREHKRRHVSESSMRCTQRLKLLHRRLDELESETRQLRRTLDTIKSNELAASPAARLSTRHSPKAASPAQTGSSIPAPIHPEILSGIAVPPTASPLACSMPMVDDSTLPANHPATRDHALEGLHMPAADADEIFAIFFRDYSPRLPIFDHRLSPEACYQQSPLLFWTIIGTACRSYSRNKGVIDVLSPKIIDMALLSVAGRKAPLQRLQSFLLILNWAYPDSAGGRSMGRTETSFALAGILLQLAMKAGLHLPQSAGEFFRVRGGDLPNISVARRCELWSRCVMAYQK
ncbi:hypothetical protein ANO11243_034520 [Dothideomycetidae sp. 11243]|nr:hypothetical protein ANO11243_034520 [fungal sp. No.11243]